MKLFNLVANVQTETEHCILPTQNRTEQLLLLCQSEKEKETRREGNKKERREGNQKEMRRE